MLRVTRSQHAPLHRPDQLERAPRGPDDNNGTPLGAAAKPHHKARSNFQAALTQSS